MIEIKPAIISEKFSEIEEKINTIESLTNWVHLDVMDGRFVVPTTWNKPADLAQIGGAIKIEVHLMVEKPEDVVSDWLPYADRLIVHMEASSVISEIVEAFSESQVELGLALELGTPLEEVKPYIEKVSLVQLMSIAEIGYHGHGFDEEVLTRIKVLRADYPDVKIQIDGGINLDTGRKSIEAGANSLAVGSFIWNSDNPKQVVSDLQNLI